METIRKIKFIGICLALAFQSISLHAQSVFDYEGITYRVITDADEASTFGTVTVTEKSDGFYEGTVIIPNAVKQSDDEYADVYKVVAIDDYAFIGSPTLTKVVLPMTIESIGNSAFAECYQLTEIEIPQGNLVQIGESAFAFSGLKSIKLPEGITEIPCFTFRECDELEEVILPNTLVKINNCAFLGCDALLSIDLPKQLREIGTHCFACSGLEHIDLPDKVTVIPLGAFEGCIYLMEVKISDHTKAIWYDSRLFRVINSIPDGASILGRYLSAQERVPPGYTVVKSYLDPDKYFLKREFLPQW